MKKGALPTFLSFPFLSLLLSSPWKGEMVVCKSTQLKLEPKGASGERWQTGSEKERIVRTCILITEMMLKPKNKICSQLQKIKLELEKALKFLYLSWMILFF